MNARALEQLDRMILRRQMAGARRILVPALKKSPADHRLLTRMARVLSDEGKSKEALTWHRRALKVAPTCPVVLWDYAETVGGRRGIELFRGIIRRGPRSLAAGCCVPSVAAGRRMITDAYWMVALDHWNLGDTRQGLQAIKNCIRRIREVGNGQFVRMRSARTILHVLQEPRSEGPSHGSAAAKS